MNVLRAAALASVLASLSNLLVASSASAQETSTNPESNTSQAPPQTAPATGVVVRWNNGLSLETSDGNNRLHLGTLLNIDGRFAPDDESSIVDSFYLRRGRILLRGRVARFFEFYIVPDFVGGQVNLIDEYVDTIFSPTLRLRFGKHKSPVGLEQLYSDPALPFAERSIANNLVPNRDAGIDVQGSAFDGRFSYVGGVRNGTNDGVSTEADTNNAKELVGRATVALGPVGVAVGVSHGTASGALPGYRTIGQQNFFAYGTGVTAEGTRTRVSPSAFVFHRWLGGYAEYMHNTQAVLKGTTTTDVTNTAWNLTGIVIVTGETLTDRGTTPAKAFDPANGQWGALELAVRASAVNIDSDVFRLGLGGVNASRTAKAFAVGLVWYNTANVKHLLTFERTTFDAATSSGRKPEHTILMRVQLSLSQGG